MNFEQAWAQLEVGARVKVSNGHANPGGKGAHHHAWRSHNFEGTLVEKMTDPRRLRIEMDEKDGARVSHPIPKSSGDTFDLV